MPTSLLSFTRSAASINKSDRKPKAKLSLSYLNQRRFLFNSSTFLGIRHNNDITLFPRSANPNCFPLEKTADLQKEKETSHLVGHISSGSIHGLLDFICRPEQRDAMLDEPRRHTKRKQFGQREYGVDVSEPILDFHCFNTCENNDELFFL